MKRDANQTRVCAVCGGTFPARHLVAGGAIRPGVVEEILKEAPGFTPESFLCRPDLNRFRARYVHTLLESERGDLTSLDREVLDSLQEHDFLSRNIDVEEEGSRTLGERLADRIAIFGGSWPFLMFFAGFLFLWIGINSLIHLWHPVDPYPYILLNLLLSCLAAVQAPVIMMSQNRQEEKDRLRAQNDYKVNLKAELEIRHLHEKMDHLLSQQWERLAQIQEIQLELLSELAKK